MPKLKTHRGAAKRFSANSKGKFKRNQSHRRHLLTKKSAKRKRHLRDSVLIAAPDQQAVKHMLPYA